MLIFNQTAIYYLKRLSSHARRKSQLRFRLTDETQVVELLCHSARSHDIETKRDFMLFYINCPENVRDYLEEGHSISAPLKNMVPVARAV